VGLVGVVAEGLADLVDEHGQVGPGHVGRGPEPLVELLFGDGTGAVPNQTLEQLQGLRGEVNGLPVA
jgi:hypothetical protein